MTGGSQGLGKAVAVELVKRGAHVTIVARGQGKLDEALAEMKVGVIFWRREEPQIV